MSAETPAPLINLTKGPLVADSCELKGDARATRRIQAVIFDLDNTLTDFMKAKEVAIQAAVDAMIDAGLPRERQTAVDEIFALYKEKGMEHQRIFNLYLAQVLGANNDRMLAAAVVAYRRARDGSLVTYPHVRMVITRLLKSGYKLAIVSDAPRFEAWLRLTGLGLQHSFDVVLTHDDTGAHKPDPRPFLMALEKLDVLPEEAVVIGDWKERDILGGRNAGLHTVYARYGDLYSQYTDKLETEGTEPDYIVDDPEELLGVLDSLNSAKVGD